MGTDFQVYTNHQNANGTWSGWYPLGGEAYAKIWINGTTFTNSHIDINTIGSDGGWWAREWSASDGWKNWRRVGNAPTTSITVGGYRGARIREYEPTYVTWPDGRQQVFVVGTDFQAYTIHQDANGTWSGWYPLGPNPGDVRSQVVVDGPTAASFIRIRVVGLYKDMFFRTWTPSGGWSNWAVWPGSTW
ncbi:hypothetical protein ACFQFC_10355 [Amorphoplanes digitatis]|uniref:PLL-like beta propeller domain-containing protein n=1 Tax=Actinoplanes digitatis TaxID=1868 RepID=A0A7W7MRT4_9ACTN|nr:hypothetical protein [Actinoplanes digitatis]MBB4764601.1 hypothetical protein [Actinoplanes digitatis]BFE74112.1 hypothetical protein GCM10020092_074130 [Actinoplanes digitatis]GID91449.1 hypothetical protein Adi01nite_08610 [Actinoplanes digitatis]